MGQAAPSSGSMWVKKNKMKAEKYRVFLFNGKNFGSWKFRTEALLDQHDLKKFIENEVITMCEGKSADEHTKLIKEEKKCKAFLINHISDDQLKYIRDQGTTRGL